MVRCGMELRIAWQGTAWQGKASLGDRHGALHNLAYWHGHMVVQLNGAGTLGCSTTVTNSIERRRHSSWASHLNPSPASMTWHGMTWPSKAWPGKACLSIHSMMFGPVSVSQPCHITLTTLSRKWSTHTCVRERRRLA